MLQIVDDFLDRSLLKTLKFYFYYGGQKQFDFFHNQFIHERSSDIENSIDKVIEDICKVDPTFIAKVGYEVWGNTMYQSNNGLDLHVDCNEFVGITDPAKRSAVLYLGDSQHFKGGQLHIDLSGRRYNETTIQSLEDTPEDFISIPFKDNRLILFNSFAPHKVTNIYTNDPYAARVTLTMAAWDKEIKINRD